MTIREPVNADLPPPEEAVAARVLDRCRALAAISERPDAICRIYLSPEHRRANDIVAGWMSDAGLTVHEDAAGNICGRSGADDAPTLLIGSHLDTVPDAGPYDGILGVLLGIETAAALRRYNLPFALEVIGFGEEEGVRFGATLMTSRAVAGTWDPAWWDLTDAAGVSLAEAFRQFGLDPAAIGDASWRGREPAGYLEAHIEQGPVLEAESLPLAVVTGIAGARRLQLTVEGMAAHAGTAPMTLRRDALAAAARIIALVEDQARASGLVATVGRIHCEPNAVNVVPARAHFTLDIRSEDDTHRDQVLERILEQAQAICAERGLSFTHTQTHGAPAAACAATLQQAIARGIESTGIPVRHLMSGAGHDAMAMAMLCPSGMLFIRCSGGVSHHPDESVTIEDVAIAARAMQYTVLALAETLAADAAQETAN